MVNKAHIQYNILILFCFSLVFNTIGQSSERYGVDSLNSIEWNKKVELLDFDGEMFRYDYYEKSLDNRDGLVIYRCGDSIPYFTQYEISPEECKRWRKADSTFYIGSSSGQVDSILIYDNKCINDYYLANKDSLSVDTIFTNKNFFKTTAFQFDRLVLEVSYDHYVKHGYETAYYRTSEIKGVCIEKNFRIKYEGLWKKGKKHGKWREYNIRGQLVKTSKYKHGELKWTKEKNK